MSRHRVSSAGCAVSQICGSVVCVATAWRDITGVGGGVRGCEACVVQWVCCVICHPWRTSTALPPSQCHCQHTPTTPPHRQWISTVPQPSRCASARPVHRLTDSAYPLHHSPHTICDQVTYTAWPSNHEAHQDMHSATQEDADLESGSPGALPLLLSLPSKLIF